MNKVQITPNKETGNLVNAYEGNPEFGYVVLSQISSTFVNGWLREQKKSTIIKGDTKALQSFVQANPTLQLEGGLFTKEYLEDEVPANVSKQHFDSSLPYEEQISTYIKRAGNEGPALMKDSKRILRFTDWVQSGNDIDSLISHDNVDEIKAFNAAMESSSADLPS